MLLSLALASLAQVSLPPPPSVRPKLQLPRHDVRRDDHGPIRRLTDLPHQSPGELEPRGEDPEGPQALSFGGTVIASHVVSGDGGPYAGIVQELSITLSNGWSESFLFQGVTGTSPRPLLVLFHKFNVSHLDTLLHTTYFQEARARNWYCLAPFGGSDKHFSSVPSQIRTEAALDWVDANFAIERTRVYAVGFSMGGGAAMNYAARHLDPDGFLFAAVANISGIVSLEDTYLNEPGVQQKLDNLFGTGALGSAEPFKMQRSSVLSFDPSTLQVDVATDLARNLMHLTTLTMRASGDIPYLITQNDVLNGHFTALGAAANQHTEMVVTTSGNFHSWDLVDEGVVCEWLRPQRLVMPTSGTTLADSNRRYFYFTVQQDAPGAFTPFHWTVDALANELKISDTANLRQLTVHTVDAGLLSGQTLRVTLSTADLAPDELRLLDWPFVPTDVQRDGVSVIDWSHDAQNSSLTLLENDGGLHVWTVVP